MSITKDQAQMIAALAVAARPSGASRWDEAGVVANLAKVRDRSLAAVVIATMQAAEDRNAHTPGVIPGQGPHWRNPESAPRPPTVAYDANHFCADCGKHRDRHPPTDHPFLSVAEQRHRVANVDPSKYLERIRDEIGDSKAERVPAPKPEHEPNPRVDELRAAIRHEESA